jgi:hypothetical protein
MTMTMTNLKNFIKNLQLQSTATGSLDDKVFIIYFCASYLVIAILILILIYPNPSRVSIANFQISS